MAFRAIFLGSDRIVSCLSTRSVRPPKSLCIIVSSPSCHEKEAAHCLRCRHFHSPRFVRRQYIAGLVSYFRRDGHRRRWPQPAHVLMICDSPPHRAREHVTALPASSATLSCRATPLTAVPFHLQPRRVRSNGRSRRRAVRAVFHGLFSLPMKHLGSDPRSIFPSAKVGLTAHRKIYLTDFYTKFQ